MDDFSFCNSMIPSSAAQMFIPPTSSDKQPQQFSSLLSIYHLKGSQGSLNPISAFVLDHAPVGHSGE